MGDQVDEPFGGRLIESVVTMRILAALSIASLLPSALPAAEGDEFFERKVRPVLAGRCQSCHGAEKQFAALRLDGRDSILKGGLNGPAAVPGQPEASLLIKAVKHLGLKMPMGSKLPEAEIAVLEEWIRAGMSWPAGGKPAAAVR